MYAEIQLIPDERRMARGALGAGSWEDHDQIVIAVAHGLGLEAKSRSGAPTAEDSDGHGLR